MPERRVLDAVRNPAQQVVAAFVALIVLGTVLLRLPVAFEGAHPGLVDALFMATSAVTVTGLGTVDPESFTIFGELVLLALAQVGGFGIMAIGAVLAVVLSSRVGLRQRMLTQTELGAIDAGEVRTLLVSIAKITVVAELLVAVVLFARIWSTYDSDPLSAAYTSVFHAVMAFNNAGLSLYSDNFARFVGDPVITLTVSAAIIVGGFGFPVIVELLRRTSPRRWTLHTRITLVATAALVVVGPLAVALFEWTNPATLGALEVPERVLAAWFQGISPRTAGFNTIDVGALNESTLLVITTLMFIGAGPASTSGGIKITTFAVLFFALWAEVRGESDVTAFRRRLSSETIRQALTVALLAVAVVIGTTLALVSIADVSLTAALFEATSAFGTVGLSTGITPGLSRLAEVLLVVVMLAGRVGPVTFVTALALRRRATLYRYPEERPIIG